MAEVQKLDLKTLEAKLWSCANVLRGTLSSAQYMDYIFGMLFLKRMNDQFNIEREQKKQQFGNLPVEAMEKVLEDPKAYKTFFVPKAARWDKLKDLNLNIGPELDKAFKAIEDEPRNSELVGVLTTANYNDKERVPDAKLNQLLQIFDGMNLSNEGLEKPDILGDAYMYLIKMFADDGGKKGGEFYTPEEVKKVMVRLLKPQEGDSIYDPTCGSGGFLISAIEYVKEQGGNHRNLQLYGQEINLSTWAIAKLNMLLHDVSGANIWKGDTIRNPQNVEGATLKTFDKVLSNPPFSLKNWGIESAEANSYGRFSYGVAPASYGDLAFVEHMIASLNSKGKMASVVPLGLLFRGSSEAKIRQAMLKDDLFEAVIGFPQNLFYGAGIPTAVIILNKNKPSNRKNKVLFIEASQYYEKDGNKNKLRLSDIDRIVETYDKFESIDRFSSVVDLEVIEENDYNLNITRYVNTTEDEDQIDINMLFDRIAENEERSKELNNTINKYMEKLLTEGIEHTEFRETKIGNIPKDWEVVKLIDVTNKKDRYSFTGGPFGSNLKSDDYTETGIRVIQLQNIGDGYFNNDYFVYTSEEKANELYSCNIFPNDIIIAKMADPVARACIIPDFEDRYLMCSDGIRLSIDTDKYDVNFIMYAINSFYFRKSAIASSTGTTRLRIGLNELRNLLVAIPPLPEQQKIAQLLASIDDRIRAYDRQKAKYDELKKGLMQKLLIGKLRMNI